MSYTLFRDSFGFTFELTKHIHYSPLKIIIFGLFYEGRSRSDNKTLKIAEFSKKCLQSRFLSVYLYYIAIIFPSLVLVCMSKSSTLKKGRIILCAHLKNFKNK